MIAPSGVGGIIGWASILVAVGVVAAVGRAVWLRRTARPGLATAEQAAAYRQGFAAAAQGATVRRPLELPTRLRRWWRQGHRDASRFGADRAKELLTQAAGPRT